jgi:hypothetical protein
VINLHKFEPYSKWGVGNGEGDKETRGQGDKEKGRRGNVETGRFEFFVSLSPTPLVPLSPVPFSLSSSQAIFGHTKIRVVFFGQSNLKRNFEAGL